PPACRGCCACPHGKVGHAWLAVELHTGQMLECSAHCIQQCTQDTWASLLELLPERVLVLPLLLGDRWQTEHNSAVEHIRVCGQFLDTIDDNRALGTKEDLVIVRVELARGEASSCRQATEGIGEPHWQTAEVVEGEYLPIFCGDHEITFVPRCGA